MSDIFISYSNDERDRILPLVSALEKTGWSVFWDRTIPAGKTWRQVIGREISSCRSVLVVWTEHSVGSEWVLEEAEAGKRKRILIPILLDNVEPPFGFGNIQAANLDTWDGDSSSPSFNRLIADIAAILGPAPTVPSESEKPHHSAPKVQRKGEDEYVREQERQRSEDDDRPQLEEANPRETNPRRAESPFEHFARLDKRQLYTVGTIVILICAAALVFWFSGSSPDKDANVKKIASLEIEGKRQLTPGEKTMLRVGGRFADGSGTELTKNLEWKSSDDSVVTVSGNNQLEARNEGFADITVSYEGIVSSPLTFMVRGHKPPPDPDLASAVAATIQEHLKAASSYRDRGEYSTALAELAKAKTLDPASKAVQVELENTKKACLAEQKIASTNLRCE